MPKVQLYSEKLMANCECQSNTELFVSKLNYPDIYIPNRGIAWSLSFMDESNEMIIKLKSDIDEYNSYVDYLMNLDGFWKFFKENGYAVSKANCIKRFGAIETDILFNLKKYQFATELCRSGEWIFHSGAKWKYSVSVGDCVIPFETEETDHGYPTKAKMGKRKYDILWNWYGDERDFCYYFWDKAVGKGWIVDEEIEDPIKSYSHFECYEQGRDCMNEPDPNIMKIFRMLQSMGYLWTYYIEPERENPIWNYRSSPDGRIGMMLLDSNYEKNLMLVDKIKILLNCAEDNVNDYILTDEYGHQFQSKQKGLYGGHNKLKIYGRMDCPSANRFVSAGKYVQHRVFFANEETAVKAGYRPCAKCMPVEYKKWKSMQNLI